MAALLTKSDRNTYNGGEMARKTIIVSALKGGTGKTTATVNIARALSRLDHKVGILDVDVTAPKLARGLGLEKTPKWKLDGVAESIIPNKQGDLYFVTMASHYTDAPAVMGNEAVLVETINQLTKIISWPQDMDYLLVDSPPLFQYIYADPL